MKNKYSSFLLITSLMGMVIILAACGITSSAQGPSLTPVPPTEVGSSPEQTVNDFLSSLQKDASGESSLGFLSPDLQADIESGHLLTTIVKNESEFKSFGVDPAIYYEDGSRATVLATLNEVSPIQRDFELQKFQDAWLISSIVSYAVPTKSLSTDEIQVSHVILDYARALSQDFYTKAWSLLSPDAQTPLTEADIEVEAQSLQNLSVTSMTLLENTPESQVFEATFWATLASDNRSDWRAGSNLRWIEAIKTNDGWRISQVDDSPIE
jgi:hypothetical protein